MKLVLLFAAGLLAATTTPAQTASPDSNSVSEPEFVDVFYRLGEAGRLMPLERQAIVATVHGIYSVKFSALIPGGRSAVRFHAGEAFDFIVRGSMLTTFSDPGSVYGMRRLILKKDHREYVSYAAAYGGLFGARAKDVARLPLDFARYGEGSIKVIADQLAPGEYAIGRAAMFGVQSVIFCFGVDK